MYEAAALAATKSMVAVALYKLMVSEYKIDVSLEKKTSTAQVLATLVTEQDTAKEGDTLAALLTFNFPAFLFASVGVHSSFFFFFALWFRIFFFFFCTVVVAFCMWYHLLTFFLPLHKFCCLFSLTSKRFNFSACRFVFSLVQFQGLTVIVDGHWLCNVSSVATCLGGASVLPCAYELQRQKALLTHA